MKEDLKKVLFQCLNRKGSGEILPFVDWQVAFLDATGERLQDHEQELNEIAEELESSKYARFENIGRGAFIVKKGVNFDEWESTMNSNKDANFNVSVEGGENIQIGYDNTQNINVTPQEFVDILNKLLEDPDQNKSILDKLNGMAEKGTTVIGLINSLKTLIYGII